MRHFRSIWGEALDKFHKMRSFLWEVKGKLDGFDITSEWVSYDLTKAKGIEVLDTGIGGGLGSTDEKARSEAKAKCDEKALESGIKGPFAMTKGGSRTFRCIFPVESIHSGMFSKGVGNEAYLKWADPVPATAESAKKYDDREFLLDGSCSLAQPCDSKEVSERLKTTLPPFLESQLLSAFIAEWQNKDTEFAEYVKGADGHIVQQNPAGAGGKSGVAESTQSSGAALTDDMRGVEKAMDSSIVQKSSLVGGTQSQEPPRPPEEKTPLDLSEERKAYVKKYFLREDFGAKYLKWAMKPVSFATQYFSSQEFVRDGKFAASFVLCDLV